MSASAARAARIHPRRPFLHHVTSRPPLSFTRDMMMNHSIPKPTRAGKTYKQPKTLILKCSLAGDGPSRLPTLRATSSRLTYPQVECRKSCTTFEGEGGAACRIPPT